MKRKSALINYMLIVLGIIILANIIISEFSIRLDITDDNRFTLSKVTKNILKDLGRPVTVTAYFSDDLPPDISKRKDRFKEMLEEYNKKSNGKVVYEFIDPGEDEKLEREAVKNGIQPVMINVRNKDEMKHKKAYIGAVLKLGGEKETIPVFEENLALEYEITSNIKKLTIENKPTIGILQGHGEPNLGKLYDVKSALSVLYNVKPVTLDDSATDLSTYKTIAIVAPTDSIPGSHLKQLNDYLNNGNPLLIAYNRVDADIQRQRGKSINTGLVPWLQYKGITIQNKFLIDNSCGAIGIQQPNFPIPIRINFPYIPVIKNFNSSHPVTKGLEVTVHQFVSPIELDIDTSMLKATILAKSSDMSGTEPSPTYLDIQKKWMKSDFPLSNIPIAAAFEGKFDVNGKNTKMIVIADGDFPYINGGGPRNQQGLNEDNKNLFVNAIDWLSDESGLAKLRTKGITVRLLDEVDDGKKSLLKYLNFLLPILLIIIFGIIKMQYNRKLRIKRMEGYV
jgi:gliding-associated putative ABC transporter substrate-binding component GldG